MKEIFRKIRAFYVQKKRLAAGVTVAVLGLLVAVGVYAMIPEVKAEGSTPIDVTKPDTYKVYENETYVIKAGTYTDTFKFVHIGDGIATVKLEGGVNFRMSEDKPAIELVGDTSSINQEKKLTTEDTSYEAHFDFVIEGQNSIMSTASGEVKSPLIKIENKEYDVRWYIRDIDNFDLNGPKSGTVKQTCSVRFRGDETSNNSSLTLTTAPGSYGAAIGSVEASAMAASVDRLSTSKELSSPYPTLTLSNGQTITQRFDGQELYNGGLQGGCGNITISTGANIFINAKGYGPGIGTGGSSNESISFDLDEDVATTHWTHTVSDVTSGSREIKITGGNLVINKETPGYCIGMGAVAGERKGDETRDRVVISGGNVKLTEGSEFINAVDEKGRKVFRYDFDITSILSSGGMTSGRSYQISRESSGQVYEVIQTGGDVKNTNDALQLSIMNEDETEKVYSFEGKVSPYFNYASGERKMYFYLYAVELTEGRLSVVDDVNLDSIRYQYKQYRAGNANGDFRNLTEGTSVPVRATRQVDIQITGVPNYCEKILVKEGSQDKGEATKNDDGTYTYSTEMPEGDLTISFEYKMATYKINYDLGLAGNNADNSANSSVGEYGKEHPLNAPTWDGYAFKGWYTDKACTQEFELPNNTLPSYNELMAEQGVTVYAKWGGAVIFTTAQQGILEDFQILVDLGSQFTTDMLPTEADLKEKGWDSSKWSFEGFKIDGSVYLPGDDIGSFEVNRNKEIELLFEAVGYKVKINAILEFRGVSSFVDINTISDFNVFFKGQPKDFTIDPNDDTFTYTSLYYANEQGETTGVIRAHGGYQIRKKDGIVVRDDAGNVIEQFMSMDDKDAFTFDMPTQNVEITVYFEEPDYTVSYYEYIEEEGKPAVEKPLVPIETEDNPNVYEFNAETPDFKLNPAKPSSKYKTFAGWYVFGDPNRTVIDTVHQGEYSKNLILIAKWDDVVTYPITINEEAKEYIKVYDSDGMEVDKGIPGEKLTIVVTPKRGVSYNKMTWYYTDENHSNCVRENTPAEDEKAPYEYPFIMPPASPVDIVGEFSLINYNITYLNLYGAENPNPLTYTVEDKIELLPLTRDGANFEGWKIVVHDEFVDESNEDYVTKEEDISTIEDMAGNLILVAHWDKEEEFNTLYKIFVNDNLVNGAIDSFASEAYKGQYVFLSVAPNAGYKLKGISYNDAEPVVYSAEKALRAVENLLDISIDVPVFEVADGIYYFIMPDHDVNLQAEFEPIEYTITYVDGDTEENPTVYTIEDEVQLAAPSKEGFEFLGWYDDEGNRVEAITNSTGNLTLTARWKQIADENPTEPPTEPEPPTEQPTEPVTPEPPAPPAPPQDKPNDSGDVIDKILAWINNNSKTDSSEDKAASNNSNKGNTGQQISTGDTANISHFVLLCIMSLIVIIIACPKKKEEEEAQAQAR